MKKRIILHLLALISVGLIASCGTRKVAIDTYKAKVEVKEATTNKVDSTSTAKQEVKEKQTTKATEQADVTQKDVTTQVKETFTPDGALVERTTTTTISDKVDRTKREATESRDKQTSSIAEVAKKVEQTANKVVDSLVKERQKEVTSKKGLGAWWILIVVAIGGFAWYWLRKRLP